jgi:DNA-binding transcriptional ArsR family regulator
MKIKKTIIRQCAVLKAINDPARMYVLQKVLEKPTHVAEFKKATKIESTLLSHHLTLLRKSGLVLSERAGKERIYRINPKVVVKGKSKGIQLNGIKVTME